jgi:hypothetical protein
MAARRLITHALLAQLAAHEFAELKLVVYRASPEFRELLLDLVGSLVSDPAALRVSVRLHFGAPEEGVPAHLERNATCSA